MFRVLTLAVASLIIGISFVANPITVNAVEKAEQEMSSDNITLEMLNAGGAFRVGDSIITITESTEENYLKSLAEKEGITYDEARELNEELFNSNSGMGTRAYDEVLRYKTLTSTRNIAGSSVYTIIGVEVAYIYNIPLAEAVAINGLGNPYIRVAGNVSSWTWDGSSPNVTWNSSSARISFTGSAYVAVTYSVGVGLEACGFSLSGQVGSTYYYWSPVVTQVMTFDLDDL